MSSTVPQTLQRAAAYLQAGQPQLARPLLIEVVKQQPDSEEGWLLLSQAVAEQRQKIDCLQRVLRINPDNREAQSRLRLLLSPPEERAAPIITPSPAPPPARSTRSHFARTIGHGCAARGSCQPPHRHTKIASTLQAGAVDSDWCNGLRRDRVDRDRAGAAALAGHFAH